MTQAYALDTTCRGENHIKRIIQEPCSNFLLILYCGSSKGPTFVTLQAKSSIFSRSFAMNSDVGDCCTLTCRMKRIRTKSLKQDKLGQDLQIWQHDSQNSRKWIQSKAFSGSNLTWGGYVFGRKPHRTLIYKGILSKTIARNSVRLAYTVISELKRHTSPRPLITSISIHKPCTMI